LPSVDFTVNDLSAVTMRDELRHAGQGCQETGGRVAANPNPEGGPAVLRDKALHA